jgi:hypothetical protein
MRTLTYDKHYSVEKMGIVCPDCEKVVEGITAPLKIGMSYAHDCECDIPIIESDPVAFVAKQLAEHPSLDYHAQHIVASAMDTDDIWTNRGAIAHETMLGQSNLMDAIERAGKLKRYGQIGIFRIVYVGTPEECQAIVDGETPF